MRLTYPRFILQVMLLSSVTGLAFSKSLIVSVAPSLPKPVATFEKTDQKLPVKRHKFYSNIKPLKQGYNKISPEQQAKIEKAARLKEQRKKLLESQKIPTKNQAWTDVFKFIAKVSGLNLKYEPAKNQLEFELKLAKGYYDLAYVNPLQFDAFRDFPGYQAQVKRKSQPLRGIIFVKRNSSITSLAQLRGSTIAFPGLLNYAASIIPRESLNRLQFKIIPQFLANANTVYYEVAREQYVAGAGTEESFLAQPPEIRSALIKIWDSPGFSPYAFVAHPRVPFFSLVKLKQAMVDMDKTEKGKKLLKYIFVNNGFEVARDSDWDEVKQINLDILNGSNAQTKAPASRIGE